jgi:dTDP-L-rhamnose 4-epimerase
LFNHYSGICRIFVGRALRGEPLIVYEDGLQTRDFVHIDDVVDANMRVLETEDANFQAFNVGSGEPTTVLAYAELVRKKLSSDLGINYTAEYRLGDNRNSVSSVDKLRSIGWEPKRSLSTILDDFLAWVERTGGIPKQIHDAYGDMRRAGVVVKATVGR